MRFVKKIFLFLLVVIAGWWLLGKLNIVPSMGNLFIPKPVLIDKTAVLIKEIKPLSQLITVSAYDEIVVDSTVLIPGAGVLSLVLPPAVYINKSVVIIGKTITHVGIDMEKLTPADMRITEDSIYLSLPNAQILDVILNPSDVEIFIEKGEWDNKTIATLKSRIGQLAARQAIQKGLLAESEKKAVEIMTQFLSAGGKQVSIDFK